MNYFFNRTIEAPGDMHFICSLHTNISCEYETFALFICGSIFLYIDGNDTELSPYIEGFNLEKCF